MSMEDRIRIGKLEREVRELQVKLEKLDGLVHDEEVKETRRENARRARVAKYIKQGLSPEEAEARA